MRFIAWQSLKSLIWSCDSHSRRMTQVATYLIPAREVRIEMTVVNSRFIATTGPVFSVEEAKTFVKRVRGEFSDASHNVPVYLVGHGSSVVAHCSDDREPSGTAGRPALAVLRGSDLGDVAVVVTRYFGGIKLGTGGLVRAYGDAVRQVLAVLPRARRIPTHTCMIAVPFSIFEQTKLLVEAHAGTIVDTDFGSDVTLTMRIPVDRLRQFQSSIQEISRGSIKAEVIETKDAIIPVSPAAS